MKRLRLQSRWLMVALVLLAAGAVHAEQHVFRLGHFERGFQLTLTENAEFRKVAFSAEPEYANVGVHRGTIPVGPEKKDLIGYAIDPVKKVAYVDLNRNQDLTDDGKGFRSPGDSYRQTYGSIPIAITDGPVAREYMIELSCWPSGTMTTATVQSGWSAKVELAEEMVQIGVIDNLDGVIDQNDRLIISPVKRWHPAQNHENARYRFGAMEHVWFNGRAYDVAYAFESNGEKPSELVVTLTDVAPPTAPLTIAGTSIAQLVLRGQSWAVVADSPGETLQVPVDTYSSQRIHTDADEVYGEALAEVNQSLNVAAGAQVTLNAGGPIGPSVTEMRSGNTLTLTPIVRGIGGEVYAFADDFTPPLPAFGVYRGDKQIFAGKFEYG
ncbi:MAG: hypothetical protein GY851_26165 [bacterium]|nr:hypothetical protein [bacterium]